MDKVTLNEKEKKRLMVLNEVPSGRLTGAAAGLAQPAATAYSNGRKISNNSARVHCCVSWRAAPTI